MQTGLKRLKSSLRDGRIPPFLYKVHKMDSLQPREYNEQIKFSFFTLTKNTRKRPFTSGDALYL